MDKQIIYEKIKTAKSQRFLTNCYTLDIVERCQQMWMYRDDFLFSYEDHGINRLVFFVKTWKAVDQLLDGISHGRYFLEFMTNNPVEYKLEKTHLTASMMRLANPNCHNVFDVDSQVLQYKGAVEIETAKEQDAEEINSILWSLFYTEISHLLSNDELREKIKDGLITVHRNADDNHIDALLQAEVMPKKFYINQIVNKGKREIIHAILLNRLEEYIKAGGKYLYAWVEERNIASVKFHEKYGMKHDGMWSMSYSIER